MNISNATLDWLSFTFKSDQTNVLEAFWSAFPELAIYRSKMVIVGGRNYAHGLCLDDNFTIRFDDDDNGKGVNVEIPSHGLEFFFSIMDIKKVRDMFMVLNQRGCKPSRIDIAMDDYSKTFRPEFFDHCFERYKKYLRFKAGDKKIKKCPTGLALVTKMRVQAKFNSVDMDGVTFYLGDRRKRMIRIYDKNSESGGSIDAIRYEVEVHACHAVNLWHHIIESSENECVVFGDYLLSLFDIRVINPLNDTVTDWKSYDKFRKFIKSTFSQRFITVPVYNTAEKIESLEKYIVQNNYSSICFMFMRHGIRPVIQAIMDKGLTGHYEALFNKFGRSPVFDEFNIQI